MTTFTFIKEKLKKIDIESLENISQVPFFKIKHF